MSAGQTSVQELAALLGSASLYACLDVRERGEFALEQIEGVTPLPRGTMEYRVRTMVPGRDIPIVVCCDDGRRSALAAATLDAMGYTKVSVLDGGLAAWTAGGRPTIAGWGVRGKAYAERICIDRKVPHMTAEELAERRRSGESPTVVDVRTGEEYLRGHVPEAYHIPGGQLLTEVSGLGLNADAPIVVSCAGRTRGILGAEMLRAAGRQNVYHLENGGMGWRLAGYELETGSGRGRPTADQPVPSWVESATRALAEKAQVHAIGLAAFEQLLASGEPSYTVDIRLPGEYRAGHVPGAIPIPTGQFALQYENFLAVRRSPVVIIADDVIRPIWAAVQCQELGFSNVLVLEGGIRSWTAAGHSLETGDMPSDAFGLDEARERVAPIAAAELDGERAHDPRVLLLDVRGSGEFGMGHIPGARWLVRGKLELGIAAIAPDRSAPIVIVCDTGVRSTLAAATLRDLGYVNIRYLDGGIAAWRGGGLAIVDGLDGADVTRAEAQGDFGSTLWAGAMARTREDMLKYLADEEALGYRQAARS